MSSRTGSHQLSNGLYVSGRPEQPKERQPTIASRAVPYTGGDVKKSGDLGKMYGINPTGMEHSRHQNGPPPVKPTSRHSSGSAVRSGPKSGQVGLTKSSSSSFSGPITPIQPTGLITTGPLGSTIGRRSCQFEPTGLSSSKALYGSAVTTLSEDVKLRFGVSRVVMWVFLVVILMGLVVGAFIMVAVKKAIIWIVVVVALVLVIIIIIWNYAYKMSGLLGFLRRYPDTELRGALDGQYVKVTGVVTCGSVPLESSFQRVQRCVYISTELYEYRGCGGKSANPTHRFLSWGCSHSEKHLADFYLSDSQSGLRALVKVGYGAKVAPLVKPTTVVDVTKDNKDLSPNFVRWLSDRSFSSHDRIMRLKEGYIREGSTVSAIGVIRRHDNMLMIVPPSDPLSTGFQWTRCLLPTYVEGLVLLCDDNQNTDVIPV